MLSRKPQSILAAAERDMQFTLSLKTSSQSNATIVRNIYECFRMLGDAVLVHRGIKSKDHTSQLTVLTKLDVKVNRPLNVLYNLRDLRHNINYEGYAPTDEDVEYAVGVAKSLFAILVKEVKGMVSH
ncbi:MAG: HEPN domain-containing protein [Candidatus Woesearchaeota archaeon]|jgi:uncharacterized protein (UPF0332 family)|nr:HEPN domain-containing protein [Candidatus Woesearchaeota archaeon]MDP7198596.1 HEPN domain-containing protein [Candidatus Woesearchaeota archaeon]MDP7466662.1 HEPN domain-containing protein [Candidatus Woesearchaeota archaeon]MDP7646918.1 HEPN domain-containing protein [Candidatus Woesearchaeota archaeon]